MLLEYQGTQIGRSAFEPQPSSNLWSSLLCTVSSVQPDMHGKYALVNREAPLLDKDKWAFVTNYLMMVIWDAYLCAEIGSGNFPWTSNAIRTNTRPTQSDFGLSNRGNSRPVLAM